MKFKQYVEYRDRLINENDDVHDDGFFSILKRHFDHWHPRTQGVWNDVMGLDFIPKNPTLQEKHKMQEKIMHYIPIFKRRADDESRKSVDYFLDALKNPGVEPYVATYDQTEEPEEIVDDIPRGDFHVQGKSWPHRRGKPWPPLEDN